MSTLISLARAIAADRQVAQPIATVRHVHISPHPLVFIPLVLAGEANAPLAAMVGGNPDTPALLTVSEPRDRDQRFAFGAELADFVLALLGWIDPPSGLTGAEAAAAAEDPVRCPPAGPATDPTFDNEILEQRILAVRTARMTGDGRAHDRAKAALTGALRTQLAPTWTLMWRAISLLNNLPGGGHVRSRWDQDREAFIWHVNHLAEAGPPQPRRDSAVSAARRLANLERVQEMLAAQRAFDDPLVMAEYRMTGEAFAGTVTAAEPDRVDATGKKRVLRPHITVQTSDIVLTEPGAVLTSPARAGQEARVIDVTHGEQTRVVLELKGGMGRSLTPEPGSIPALGEEVCYATFTGTFQRPPAFPPPEETPWTHGGPPPQYVPSNDDAREDWS